MQLAPPLQQVDRTFVLHRGRKLIYFGGCDYFRMSSHPAVLEALREGVDQFGLNVAASRSTTGNHALFGKLERELARFFGQPAAALFSNGYATNFGFTQTFADDFTHAFIDERAHGSLKDAAEFLHCRVSTFHHRDVKDFRAKLQRCGRNSKALTLTDGMFSHDGSVAPLGEYLEALPRNGLLLIDDAHGAGVLGKHGRGTLELLGVRDRRVVQTISLSKAFGVYGGAVLGSKQIIRAIQRRSRLFNGNTPLPLPLVCGALESVKVLRHDASLRRRLIATTEDVKSQLRIGGFAVVDTPSPVVSLVPRNAAHASQVRDRLLRANIFPTLIRYSGPASGYFRFALSSEHTRKQTDSLVAALLNRSADILSAC